MDKIQRKATNELVLQTVGDLVKDRCSSGTTQDINKITILIESYLGIGRAVSCPSDVMALMDTTSGVTQLWSQSLPTSVVASRRAKAKKMAARDFKNEWAKAMSVPIDSISKHFYQLKTGRQNVVVTK